MTGYDHPMVASYVHNMPNLHCEKGDYNKVTVALSILSEGVQHGQLIL